MAIDYRLDETLATRAPRDLTATRRFSALRELGRKPDAVDPRTAHMAATQMLSQVFFAPMLAEIRASSLGEKFSGGGLMGGAMGEQLDLRLADAAAAGNPGGLVSLLEKKFGSAAETRAAESLQALDPGRARQLLARRGIKARPEASKFEDRPAIGAGR